VSKAVDAPRIIQPALIRMGEMAVAQANGTLRTLLGSCMGLALYDRRKRVAGVAHIVLPESRGKEAAPGKFVDTAIPALRADMEELAGTSLRLVARLAGGANMFATDAARRIGDQNIEATEALLKALRVPVVGRHCGGTQGRRMTMNASSGVITIEIAGCEPVEI